jgi:hypothetical protein
MVHIHGKAYFTENATADQLKAVLHTLVRWVPVELRRPISVFAATELPTRPSG